MTLRNGGAPTGFARLLTPVLFRAVRRATIMDLSRPE
jgi:hypothetical protein